MNFTVGFIGQGWIGRNYGNVFEKNGVPVVRYSLEAPFVQNKELIAKCTIVFIAVPTPTTPTEIDISAILNVMPLIQKGAIVVIKSTIPPGTTIRIQAKYPDLFVLHSPEFLSEATAEFDAEYPKRNIVGIPKDEPEFRERATQVLSLLPKAPFELICSSTESELIKYGANTFYYTKVVYMNMLYDFAKELGCDWQVIKAMYANDPWVGPMHLDPIHKNGRGAGGNCLIKDFAAFKRMYTERISNTESLALLEAIEKKNLALLKESNKNQEYVERIYGNK